MQLFYTPDISENTTTFGFSKEESKHIFKVLRKKTGDQLHITNGKGWLFEARLVEVSQKNCTVEILSSELQPKRNYELHMAVAPTKMNDRFEWFLEKSTEIGIDSITPIYCDRSERKIIKPERFEKIVQSAMKQSLNCYLPKLNPALTFKEFILNKDLDQCFIAHCEDLNKSSLKSQLIPSQKTVIMIGPEGDFSPSEITLAIQNNCIPISLGDTRLRTETAAIVACHSVAFINQS